MTLAPGQTDLLSGTDIVMPDAAGDPADGIAWERRDARLLDHRDGSVAFEQLGVEVPAGWSQNATNILAQKYFRGPLGTPEREWSLRQVVDRVVGTITEWGDGDGYFADESEASLFRAELSYLLYAQRAAFNSPVWFNIGVAGVPQQASACFILSVDDTMESILEWYAEEGRIFKGGSGAGVNLSRIRASSEPLSGGGTASGPVSFMRGADASAGTIKSGGKTRRAAKMVVLDADHPDIEAFIWCKAREERKSRALAAAGFDMGVDGADSNSVQYQNANNSVRVTDGFMGAAAEGRDWDLTARADGAVLKRVAARSILRQMAEAAWECADPGVQFATTINRWHTASVTGPITASNPCSEYVHLDDSACNLASINLLSFLDDDGSFDVSGFRRAVQVVFAAQEILVGHADYPTQAIADTTGAFRQVGLGYANLGALLMAMGLPYDSDEGRAVAAAITALMTGEAYLTSTRLAERMGPFAGFHANREPMLRVLDQHRTAAASIDEDLAPADLLEAAQLAWDEACERADRYGVRNSQATVLAPTGTIGLIMDCDTTGIEPDLGLVKSKRLVGGGTMHMVNTTVPRALRRLGYDDEQVRRINDHIAEHHDVVGAPLEAEHRAVFACSLGDDAISTSGHIGMMAAVQPFLSGAISKTVNMPAGATVDDVEKLFIGAWRLGLKSVAIYRDCSKVGQPLTVGTADGSREPRRPRPIPSGGPAGRRGSARRAGASAASEVAPVAHVRVPGGRLQGVRDGGGVPRRPAGRDLREGLQTGLDAGWDHGRLRDLAQPRPAVRGPAGRLRRDVRGRALRARRHHRRSRHPHRHQPHGLPVPQAGGDVPDPQRAGRAGRLHHRRADPAHASRRRGAGRRDRAGPRPPARSALDPLTGAADGPARLLRGRGTVGAGRLSADGPAGRAVLHDLWRPHAPRRLVLRVRRLRRHQRLQLTRDPPPGGRRRSI